MQEIVNKKATMVVMNGLGFVSITHVTIKKLEYREPFQRSVSKNICVWYTKKGRRKTEGYSFEQIAIFEGWQGSTQNSQPYGTFCFDNGIYEQAKKGLTNMVVEHNSRR